MVLFETLWNGQYWTVAVLAAFLTLPILAIVYMLGKAVSSNQLMAWSKDELYQLFGSFVIIAVVVSTLALVSTVVLESLNVGGFKCFGSGCSYIYETFNEAGEVVQMNAICNQGSSDPCHIALAKASIDAQYDLVRYYTADQLSWAGFIGILSGTEIPLSGALKSVQKAIPSLTLSPAPFAGLTLLIDVYDNLLPILYGIVFLIKANWFFLEAVNRAIFPFFLVAGIALRSLSITRKIGGLMLATALVLFFIYPMVIILTEMLISPNPNVFKVDLGFVYGRGVSDTFDLPQIYNGIYVDIGGGRKLDIVSYSIFKPISPYSIEDGSIRPGGILDTTAFITIWVLFQYLIIMYATVISIREMSPFFGGDVDIAGLSRLL